MVLSWLPEVKTSETQVFFRTGKKWVLKSYLLLSFSFSSLLLSWLPLTDLLCCPRVSLVSYFRRLMADCSHPDTMSPPRNCFTSISVNLTGFILDYCHCLSQNFWNVRCSCPFSCIHQKNMFWCLNYRNGLLCGFQEVFSRDTHAVISITCWQPFILKHVDVA